MGLTYDGGELLVSMVFGLLAAFGLLLTVSLRKRSFGDAVKRHASDLGSSEVIDHLLSSSSAARSALSSTQSTVPAGALAPDVGVEALVGRLPGRAASERACRSFADAVADGDFERAEVVAATPLRANDDAVMTLRPPRRPIEEGEER